MEIIKKSIESRKTLVIRDKEGNVRAVQPYALFQGKQEVLLHCYQVEGHSATSAVGWKNIKLSSIESAQEGPPFEPRQDFNPGKLKGIL